MNDATSPRTGLVGLGAMGAHMARSLHRAALLAGVWNRTTARATALAAETGCAAPASLAELAGLCNVVVLCVSADEDVLACIDALLPGAHPGLVVVDCSTVSADTAREAARRSIYPSLPNPLFIAAIKLPIRSELLSIHGRGDHEVRRP